VKADETDDGQKRGSHRPSPKSAGKSTLANRGKFSTKKAQAAAVETDHALQGQLQRQREEICQLHEMVDQLSQAGTPPVTLPKVHQSPLPGQVAIAITCHRRRLEVLQCLDISGFTIRHSRCLLCRYKPEIEFRHGTRRRCQLRQRGNMGLRHMDIRPATRLRQRR